MFGTIRKHQTWLWLIIIGIMILGLIQWQNSLGNKGDNNERGQGDFGAIDGRAITQTEINQAHNEALLNYFVNTRQWPDTGVPAKDWNQTVEDYKQVFLTRKLQQYNVHTDPDIVARYGGAVIQRVGGSEGLTPEQFLDFIKSRNISPEDFQRYLQHQLSVQQLATVLGDPGRLVSPGEIESLYIQTHQERTADAVFFSASNYLASIPEPTPAILGEFYTNEMAAYREPDQMQLSYVLFNITNYLSQAEKDLGTNLTADVENTYLHLGTNVLMFGKTPEEAKTKIRERIIRESALTNAASKALAFQTELLRKDPLRPDNLSSLAKEKGLQAKVTEPFDKEYGPSDIHLDPKFPVASLFDRSADDPFPVHPIGGPDGVYVVGYNQSIASHVPSLDQIRSRVISDYKLMQATRIAQGAGRIFAENATNALAKGKSFAAISADAKESLVQLPAFSESTESLPQVEDHVDLNTFKRVAFDTPVGKTSQFIPMQGGGFMVYVREQLPIDQAKMKADLPEFSQAVRSQRENEAFQAWFAREANAALNNIPEVRDAVQRERGRS